MKEPLSVIARHDPSSAEALLRRMEAILFQNEKEVHRDYLKDSLNTIG